MDRVDCGSDCRARFLAASALACGIALLTPEDVHHGNAQERTHARQVTLDAARAAHPERFVRGRPKPPQLPAAPYINRPLDK